MFSQQTATAGARGNGQDPGTTLRVPATAYLMVDSFDRNQGAQYTDTTLVNIQPLNNFTIQKRQTFISGFFNRIALTEVRFPFASPNINPLNNSIRFYDSTATEHVITIPIGFYTPDELAAELDTQLTAAIPGQTWAVTYNEETCNFTVTSNANFSVAPFQYPSSARTLKGLFYMMGFTGAVPALTTSTIPGPNMQYTQYVDICSRALTQFQQVKDNSTRENQAPGIVCRLYLNNFTNECLGDGNTGAKLTWPGCRMAMVHRLFPVPKQSAWHPGQFVDAIDISLYDDAGEPLYYPDTAGGKICPCDFQLTFELSEN